jgi:hypothetical protein
VSPNQTPLDADQFKASLPHILLEYSRAKTIELQHRLREMRNVLEYPKTRVNLQIEMIINGITEVPKNGR